MTDPIQTRTVDWLEQRDPPPPFELKRRIIRAVEFTTRGDTEAERLVEAAVTALRNAIRLGDERSAANDLLCADALLTYACEFANEQGPEELQQLVNRLDVEFFQTRILTPS